MHTTASSSSHLASLKDSDSLSLAAGEIGGGGGGYGKSPDVLYHSKFIAPTAFGALRSSVTAARENVVGHDDGNNCQGGGGNEETTDRPLPPSLDGRS